MTCIGTHTHHVHIHSLTTCLELWSTRHTANTHALEWSETPPPLGHLQRSEIMLGARATEFTHHTKRGLARVPLTQKCATETIPSMHWHMWMVHLHNIPLEAISQSGWDSATASSVYVHHGNVHG